MIKHKLGEDIQTVTIQVQDGFMPDFLLYVESQKEKISMPKDKNLELDPYFYERRKRLHKIRESVKNGTAKMLSEEEYEREMELFFQKLENSNES